MRRTIGWMVIWALISPFCSSVSRAMDMGEIRCGQTRSGVIAIAGEKNTWTFPGQAGDQVTIDAQTTLGPLSPFITLSSLSGPAEASGEVHVSLVLKQSGVYKITVRDKHWSAAGRYNITLACEPAPRPDLMVRVVIEPNLITLPQGANVLCTVVNGGQLEAPSTRLRVYLSEDPNYDDQDIQIDSEEPVAGLKTGDEFNSPFKLVSAAYGPGRYYVIAVVDPVPDERNVGNNVTHVRLTIKEKPCSLDISSTEGGSVVEPHEGVFAYDCGSMVDVNAVAEPCYHFTHWTGTAVDLAKVFDANDSNAKVPADGDYTLRANFARDVVVLSISPVGCGVIEPNEGTRAYECGAIVPIRAVPCECYRFTHWSGTAVDANKVADPCSPDTMVTMDASYTVQANFELKKCTLTVVSDQGGSVSVTLSGSEPSIVAPGEQRRFEYDCNTPVTLRAVAEPNHHFCGWNSTCVDGNGAATPEMTVTLLADRTVEATFVRECGLTITHTACGRVEPYEGAKEQPCEASVTAKAVPCDCYDFSHWSGSAVPAGKEHDNPITVQVTGIDALCANFILRTYTLTLSSTDGGQISSPGEGKLTYDCGTCVPIIPVPEDCYLFSHWSGTAVDKGKVPNPKDPNVTLCMDGDYELQANFVRAKYTLTIFYDPNGAASPERNGPYECGECVKVWAMPSEYCTFTHWSGTCVDAGMVHDPNSPETCVWMYGDCTLKANFACEQRTLDVSSTVGGYLSVMAVRDGGSITWLGDGTYRFPRGTVVTAEAFAEPGYVFRNWSGMIWSSDNWLVLILDEDYKLKANFQAIP